MSGAALELEPAVPPKEDPETLVLRGRPRAVVRFRRGLVVGLAGAAAAALAAVTWLALEPPSFRMAGIDDGGKQACRRLARSRCAHWPGLNRVCSSRKSAFVADSVSPGAAQRLIRVNFPGRVS